MMRMERRLRLPSPAMMVAVAALLVALSGTAVAATAIVPLAKRALTADKAKVATLALNSQKLGGQTSAALVTQASQAAGPASTAASLVTVKTAPFALGAGAQGDFAATCDSGQKAVGGGYDNPVGTAFSVDTRPTPDGASWKVYLVASPSGPAAGLIYAVCLK